MVLSCSAMKARAAASGAPAFGWLATDMFVNSPVRESEMNATREGDRAIIVLSSLELSLLSVIAIVAWHAGQGKFESAGRGRVDLLTGFARSLSNEVRPKWRNWQTR